MSEIPFDPTQHKDALDAELDDLAGDVEAEPLYDNELERMAAEHVAQQEKEEARAHAINKELVALARKADVELASYEDEIDSLMNEAKRWMRGLKEVSRSITEKVRVFFKSKPPKQAIHDGSLRQPPSEFMKSMWKSDVEAVLSEFNREFQPSESLLVALKNAKTIEEKIDLIRHELEAAGMVPLPSSPEPPIVEDSDIEKRMHLAASNFDHHNRWRKHIQSGFNNSHTSEDGVNTRAN